MISKQAVRIYFLKVVGLSQGDLIHSVESSVNLSIGIHPDHSSSCAMQVLPYQSLCTFLFFRYVNVVNRQFLWATATHTTTALFLFL